MYVWAFFALPLVTVHPFSFGGEVKVYWYLGSALKSLGINQVEISSAFVMGLHTCSMGCLNRTSFLITSFVTICFLINMQLCDYLIEILNEI